jgi:glycosyltransferase involved in cell wall biosynthesis
VSDEFFNEWEPIDPASRTLVCVGRLSAQKGHLLLLDAARKLADNRIDFRLVLAGDGDMRREIETKIQALGLQSHVEITGWIDEAHVRQHIQQARAVVQPSFAEGLPVVLMEALALRRPVIATSIAGIPELVEHNVNGWLVPAGNTAELYKAMRAALGTPATQLDEMGACGSQRVWKLHRTCTEVDALETLLTSTADRSGGA